MTSMMTSMLVLLMLSVTCDLVSARSTLETFWEELERLMNEKESQLHSQSLEEKQIFGHPVDKPVPQTQNVPKKPMLTANILSGSTVPVGTEVMFTCATTSTPGAFTYTYQFNNVAFVVESGTYTHTLSSYYKGKTIRIICSSKEKGGAWSEPSDPYILHVTESPSCDVSLTGSSGEFSSPGYDQGDEYTNNLQCDYSVTVAEGQTVQITFQSPFNVESCNGKCCDAVKIYDGPSDTSSLLVTSCGNSRWYGVPIVPTSSSHQVLVRFTTDGSYRQRGFKATFTAVSSDYDDVDDRTHPCPFC